MVVEIRSSSMGPCGPVTNERDWIVPVLSTVVVVGGGGYRVLSRPIVSYAILLLSCWTGCCGRIARPNQTVVDKSFLFLEKWHGWLVVRDPT
jgi:hypothetical protein